MTCYSFKGLSSQLTIMQSQLNQSVIGVNLKTSILFLKCCSQLSIGRFWCVKGHCIGSMAEFSQKLFGTEPLTPLALFLD